MEEKCDFHIFDLNDDCLTEIVKYLYQEDLQNLHKAHSRFNEAIGNVLPKIFYTFGKQLPEIDYFVTFEESYDRTYDETFLKQFGDKI